MIYIGTESVNIGQLPGILCSKIFQQIGDQTIFTSLFFSNLRRHIHKKNFISEGDEYIEIYMKKGRYKKVQGGIRM